MASTAFLFFVGETMELYFIHPETDKVPGIAARGAEILAGGEGDDCVTNTYQLIGKFMMLRGPDKDDHEVWSDAGEGRAICRVHFSCPRDSATMLM